MPTFIDVAIAVIVLAGTLGLVVTRALLAWRRFHIQQYATRLTEEGSLRLLRPPTPQHRSRS